MNMPAPLSPKLTKRLLIHGRVQGVFFRDSMQTASLQLGITGWVRNRDDGTVEALVQGTEAAIAEITRWAHHGPRMARVDLVESELLPADQVFHDFVVRR